MASFLESNSPYGHELWRSDMLNLRLDHLQHRAHSEDDRERDDSDSAFQKLYVPPCGMSSLKPLDKTKAAKLLICIVQCLHYLIHII